MAERRTRPHRRGTLVLGMVWLLAGLVFGLLWLIAATQYLPLDVRPQSMQTLLTGASLLLPHGFLLLLAGCLLLCFGSWKQSFRLLSALVALSIMALWGSSWVKRPMLGGNANTRIRVMTWNVARLGEYCGSGDCSAEEAAAMECMGQTLDHHQPDLLALQEISLDRLEEIERSLGLRCRLSDKRPAWIDYEGRHISEHGGVAVCVPPDGSWTLQSLQNPSLPPDWYYIFTEVKHSHTGDVLNFLSVHFKPTHIDEEQVRQLFRGELSALPEASHAIAQTATEQSEQANRLLSTTAHFDDPTILAGDFNSTRDARIHHGLRTQFLDTWERGGWGYGASRVFAGIPLRIDYIYASTTHFRVQNARRDLSDCSDHHAVISTLRLN